MLDGADPGAVWRANNHRTGQPAPRAGAQPRGMVHQLVDRRVDEAGELDLRYRAEALGREPDRHSRNEPFGKGCVEHAVGSVPVDDRGARTRTRTRTRDSQRSARGDVEVDGHIRVLRRPRVGQGEVPGRHVDGVVATARGALARA